MSGQVLVFWWKDPPGKDRYSILPIAALHLPQVEQNAKIEFVNKAIDNRTSIQADWIIVNSAGKQSNMGEHPCLVLGIAGEFFRC